MRTLVVDDDPDQRTFVRTLLTDAGIGPITEAQDGTEALAIAQDVDPQLVLLDLAMPGPSGLVILPDLIALVPSASVVVVSNFPRRRVADLAIARGAVGYVEKRTPPERLVEEILVAAALTAAAAEPITAELAADTTSPRQARLLIQDLLGSAADELVDTVQLLVTELVTNAVVHAASAPRLEIHLGRATIRIAVYDDDATMPERREPDVDRPGGRGLHLLDLLATRWGSEPHPPGKVVWFEVDRP